MASFADSALAGSERVPEPRPDESRYRRLFAIREIEQARPLQLLAVALLVSFFLTFHDWARAKETTATAAREGLAQCWPYWQDCSRLLVLEALPNGYSQTTVYAVLFAVMVSAAVAMAQSRWVWAHGLLSILFAWKVFVSFAMTMAFNANYNYFHLIFTFLFLFAHHKLFFLRRAFVALYVLASLIKLNDGWIAGTYFSSLSTGLPLVPEALIPVATNVVIVVEMLVAPLLLARSSVVQRVALFTLVAFHLYSTILVMYRYPTMVLGPLICLFGPRIDPVESPLDVKSAVGWATLASLIAGQCIPRLIQGDERLTLEGNYFGLYMFEANHQCRSTTRIHYANGKKGPFRSADRSHAHHRCDPYSKWFRLKQLCDNPKVESIEWTFDHSINGAPFRRIVDEPDACRLTYEPLVHNPWIRTEAEADVVAEAAKNVY